MTNICFTSVQVTACTPPSIVYTVVDSPMMKIVTTSSQPSTMDRMTEGAAMMTPTPSPRDTRKKKLVSVRVFASKRCSRYSYAVNTFAR